MILIKYTDQKKIIKKTDKRYKLISNTSQFLIYKKIVKKVQQNLY